MMNLTRSEALHLLSIGLDHPGKNLRVSVPIEPVATSDQGSCIRSHGEAQEGTNTKLERTASRWQADSCGPQSPLEQELHKLEQHYGLPPREPVTLTECLWELSRRMSGLEVQPPTFSDELWED